MSTLYIPKYLKPEELCDRDFYNKVKNATSTEVIFWQFNPYVLMTADMLRERFGAITVNTWSVGGNLSQRGLRTNDSTGAAFGPHKRGAALDCNFKDASAIEIRNVMKEAGCFKPGFKSRTDLGKDECFKYIGRVEMNQNGKPITWFHFDIWNNQNADGSILSFNG